MTDVMSLEEIDMIAQIDYLASRVNRTFKPHELARLCATARIAHRVPELEATLFAEKSERRRVVENMELEAIRAEGETNEIAKERDRLAAEVERLRDALNCPDNPGRRDANQQYIRAGLLRDLMEPSGVMHEAGLVEFDKPPSGNEDELLGDCFRAMIRAFAAERNIQLDEANHD